MAGASAGGSGGRAEQRRTLCKIGLTSLLAGAAESATFPIDLIKTRLQVHSDHLHHGRSSATLVVLDLWRKRGFLGFYNGSSPAILRHLLYTPIRIVGYEHLRSVAGIDGSIIAKAVAGGVSGVFAQVVASPADLIKVRMQADGRLISQGLQPRYTGIFDALRKIIRSEGFLGLWKGVYPSAQRAFLVNMGDLTCYDQAKQFILSRQICGDNVVAHSLASVVSGLSTTALSCPADVVKTRMMNQINGKETSIAYRNSYDCLVKSVKFEGIMALWKGFFPTWARIGPWQLRVLPTLYKHGGTKYKCRNQLLWRSESWIASGDLATAVPKILTECLRFLEISDVKQVSDGMEI